MTDEFRARMLKKTNPNVKVTADMALGAAKRLQLTWEQDTPKPTAKPEVKQKAQAKAQAALQIEPTYAQKTVSDKRKMLRETGLEINPTETAHTGEEDEQQEQIIEATPSDWMEAEVVMGVADVPNTNLEEIEKASSGIMFVDKQTLESLKAENINAKVAVLTPAHAGTPKDKVIRIPAKLKSG